MTKNEKTAGILGGMGPEATVDLMQRIIRLTPALDDIDHIRCIVDNNPKVPSRIKAIIRGDGEDPGPCMAQMAQGLERAGADFLAIACNTAHHYYDAVQTAVEIPVIHMVEKVLAHLQTEYPGLTRAGVLASPAIRITGLYEKIFRPAGITITYPDPPAQDNLFSVIRAVKAGDLSDTVRDNYSQVCENLLEKGVDVAIVACTELSALDMKTVVPTEDAAQVLARAIVDTALGKA